MLARTSVIHQREATEAQFRHVLIYSLALVPPDWQALILTYYDFVRRKIWSLSILPHMLDMLWRELHYYQLPNLHNRSPAAPYQVAIDVLVL